MRIKCKPSSTISEIHLLIKKGKCSSKRGIGKEAERDKDRWRKKQKSGIVLPQETQCSVR